MTMLPSIRLPRALYVLASTCLISLAVTGCSQANNAPVAPQESRPMSLIGTPLRDPAWSAQTRANLETDLRIARAAMEIAPDREESYIWVGRRLAYLERFPEAIDVFTRGLNKFPDSYKLLRFRGRKLARSRQFTAALADYARGIELMKDIPDSYEPDGIPNARNQFLGSYRGNMHYYWGQTSWAIGDYEAVLHGMERSGQEPLAQNPDHLLATKYWRYLALRKLGRDAEASAVIHDVPADLELLENFAYYDGVRFMQGRVSREELLVKADPVSLFAVAMDHHFGGEKQQAEALWETIIRATPQGFWPAETELLASRGKMAD
jgi:tetratricopeptide (TPR) repeat protein